MQTREHWAGIATLLLALGLGAQEPAKNPPPKPAESKPQDKPAPAANSLDAAIADALKNNPEIQAANARLREAEIQVNKIRSEVMVNVAAQHEVVRNAREMIRKMEEMQQKKDQLFKSGQLSSLEYSQSQSDLFRARSEVAKLEAELTKLIGRVPGSPNQTSTANPTYAPYALLDIGERNVFDPRVYNPALANYVTQPLWAYRVYGPTNSNLFVDSIWLQDGLYSGKINVNAVQRSTTISDKLRSALELPVKLDVELKETSISEILDLVKKKGLAEVPLRIMLGADVLKTRMDLMSGELPLSAWLVAIQDSVPNLRFVVREYGLLATTTERVPPDGLLLHQFTRQAKSPEAKPKEDKKDEKPK